MGKSVILSAGGTGGHLFPAQALAQELKPRGWTIHLATDARAEKFLGDFPADTVHIIPSATFGGKSPVALAKTCSKLAQGYFKSRGLIRKLKPDVAVGFGGYPTVPPLLAASHKGVKTVLHEQNAVLGRANTFLANKVTKLASGFPLVSHPENADVVLTGNPMRERALEAAKIPYDAPQADGLFHLLVFGGSQGARFFSQIIPEALAILPPEMSYRLRLTLQSRPEDSGEARGLLLGMDVAADVESFFTDLPERIAKSHLVISRSGASTVAELSLIGRPSILVPLPGSLDDDQGANAALLDESGGAVLMRQKDLSAEKLASMLKERMEDPAMLAIAAENAKKAGMPEAAANLADLVEGLL